MKRYGLVNFVIVSWFVLLSSVSNALNLASDSELNELKSTLNESDETALQVKSGDGTGTCLSARDIEQRGTGTCLSARTIDQVLNLERLKIELNNKNYLERTIILKKLNEIYNKVNELE